MSLLNDLSPASPVSSDDPPPPGGARRDLDRRAGPSGRTWSIILGAGLLAGLFSFGIGEVTPNLFAPSFDPLPVLRAPSPRLARELRRRNLVFNDRAAALTYGGLGLLLGLSLGAAGGLARRSTRSAIAAGVTGLVLGGPAGAATAFLVLPSYHAARAQFTEEDHNSDLALALRTHGAIWLAIGAAAGLALGFGLGGGAQVARATVGGVLGAAVAAVIYEFGGALVFPLAETFQPVAKYPTPRLWAHLSMALCVAAGALWAVHHLRLRRAKLRASH